MIYNADTIAQVDAMFIRRFTPASETCMCGGVLIMPEYTIEDVGMASNRLSYDEDAVDCSFRILEITSSLALACSDRHAITVFPSRRWRNFRQGNIIQELPTKTRPLLYIGNPIRIIFDRPCRITVHRTPEFLIKSGPELGC